MKNKEKLENQIRNANQAYAIGQPFLSDDEYHELWKELREIDPANKLLYHTSNDKSIQEGLWRHKTKIKGVAKAFDMEDLKPFLARFGNDDLVLEPKYDGCAAVLYPQQSGEIKVILSGDGTKGQDVTRHFPSLNFSLELRNVENVEIVIPLHLWAPFMGKNPRNTVAGWLARDESPELHEIADIISHERGELRKTCRYNGDLEAFSTMLLQSYVEWSELYPIDGIMIKLADRQKRVIVDTSLDTYNYSLAWKPPIQVKETTVTEIEWNVSRSGRVIPTVIYKEIELCGTTNQRATANNAAWLTEREIVPGSIITVGKAGEIIPKILQKPIKKVEKDSEHFCPVCSSPLSWEGRDLVCHGEFCIAQHVKKIHYFYSDKGMDLKNIGESMIEKLLQEPNLRNHLMDHPYLLLDPRHNQILSLIRSVWGEKRTENYLRDLDALQETKTEVDFIASFGLKGLAKRTVLKLYQFVKGGPMQTNISHDARVKFISLYSCFRAIKERIPSFKFAPVPPSPVATFTITGKLSMSRNEAVQLLANRRWQFVNQVSRFTNYLIVGDEPGRTKLTKAKELGTKILKEEEIKW